MKITYIHHSCFSVEIDDLVMIFDYYRGSLPEFDPGKQIFVFASHKHGDHFNKCIFDLVKVYPNITFLLSNDIRMNEAYMDRIQIPPAARQNIIYTRGNESLKLPSLTVETLSSTDEGVAFIVTARGRMLYHAGDMNWWTWPEDTEKEYKDMTQRFLNEMEKLEGRHFDAAFVPLDPRQEDRFWWGFHHFMKITDTDRVFPMHFQMDYSIICRLKGMKEVKEYADKVMEITEEGQQFTL